MNGSSQDDSVRANQCGQNEIIQHLFMYFPLITTGVNFTAKMGTRSYRPKKRVCFYKYYMQNVCQQ